MAAKSRLSRAILALNSCCAKLLKFSRVSFGIAQQDLPSLHTWTALTVGFFAAALIHERYKVKTDL